MEREIGCVRERVFAECSVSPWRRRRRRRLGGSRGRPSAVDAFYSQLDMASALETIRSYYWRQDTDGSCIQSRMRKGRAISRKITSKREKRQMQPSRGREKREKRAPSRPRAAARSVSGPSIYLSSEGSCWPASCRRRAWLSKGAGRGSRGGVERGRVCV